jgi:hypothetical protein
MSALPNVRYLPQRCPFVKREVWAIVVRQPTGRWRIVNCLDKDKGCFQQACAFTTDTGQWPFEERWVENGSHGEPA